MLNRSARRKEPKKILTAATEQNGSQVNFYYGAPTPYAESIAPSHHSTYAHYYDDEEDGWEMPNFYNETYMKGNWRETEMFNVDLLKPTGYVLHQQFNIQQLYLLPTLYLCVLYLSENKQRLVPLTA